MIDFRSGKLIVVVASLTVTAFANAQFGQDERDHMAESVRTSIASVAIISGESPTKKSVTGDYGTETEGLWGGMDSGSRIGTIQRDVGPVPVGFGIPGLAIPGAIYGGIKGFSAEQIQEFRDALTDELAKGDSVALRNDGIALDAFWVTQRIPGIRSQLLAASAEIPEGTETALFIELSDLVLDIQGKEAIITIAARGTLVRLSDQAELYVTTIEYQDRDELGTWTENENRRWRDFTNYARHYLGRAVADDVFARVQLKHDLQPDTSGDVKQDRKKKRRFITESTTPTLSWHLELDPDFATGAFNGAIPESDIYYDIEIYDAHQLVYDEQQVPDAMHTLAWELEPCQVYRWSVRPVYVADGDLRVGDWLRYASDAEREDTADKGLIGRQASVAPAYTQDFPELSIACR